MKHIKYIGEYTYEELNSNNVFLCINEEGFLCILIKNELNKQIVSNFYTDNLEIKLNTSLLNNGMAYNFHIINSRNNDYFSKIQFQVIFDYLFSKIDNPIKDSELSILITSLEDFFKTSPEKDYKLLQIGVFGELLVLKKLYDHNYKEIVNKYHENFYSKHDIEIKDNLRIEVKTTTTEKRIHKFKHAQISRSDVDVIIASVIVEECKEGLSLYDMFMDVLTCFTDPEMIFALRKLMKKCNVSEEDKGLIISKQIALENIKFYNATILPKLDCDIPDEVTDIAYNVDCSHCVDIDVDALINDFLKEK